ncbi:hypothetical protein FM21_15430 [Streptomyces mutabilis]|uniref:Uncharacterized protein n=1 Tax=Streptomyces mutabilis TaxID=67332 RepID=A0A086N8A7_9ACTN|nr:hypothetical protein FM21_15430 [Streptomyces mutabilis]
MEFTGATPTAVVGAPFLTVDDRAWPTRGLTAWAERCVRAEPILRPPRHGGETQGTPAHWKHVMTVIVGCPRRGYVSRW